MCGMEVAQAICLFSFTFYYVTYPCAVVHWFSCILEKPDNDTGMWMVAPDFYQNQKPVISVIHVDCICYEHRPLRKHFKRHVTVGITPDRFLVCNKSPDK